MKRFLVLIIFCVIGSKAFAQQSNSFVYLDSLIIHGNTAVFKTKQDAKSIVEYLKKKYKGIMILGGHEDGILAWGDTAGEVGNNLLNLLDKTANLS